MYAPDRLAQINSINAVRGRGERPVSDRKGEQFRLVHSRPPGRSRITDPALMATGNIYTRSLDTNAVAEIQAKPVFRDGEIRTLYISDGRKPE
jgi:hypothetical protein